jgi:hypothetical protein
MLPYTPLNPLRLRPLRTVILQSFRPWLVAYIGGVGTKQQ